MAGGEVRLGYCATSPCPFSSQLKTKVLGPTDVSEKLYHHAPVPQVASCVERAAWRMTLAMSGLDMFTDRVTAPRTIPSSVVALPCSVNMHTAQ